MKPTVIFSLSTALGLTLCSFSGVLAETEPGFVSLFNGKDLTHWDGKSDFWSVEDGAITGRTTKEKPTNGNTFIIWRGGEVADFELRLKYKIVGGNSGIQYRSKDTGNWVVGGYQADFEAGTTYSGIVYEERGRGILAKRGERTTIHTAGDKHSVEVVGSLGDTNEIQKVIKNEDWNDYKIIARGNQLTHVINGRVTTEVTDLDAPRRTEKGILALQLHAGPPMVVQFKDIRIKHDGAVDLSGDWAFEVATPNGKGEPAISFSQAGNVLTGKYDGLLGKQDIKGKVDGQKVTFSMEGEYEGNAVQVDYTGEVAEDGTMKGSIRINDNDTEITWSAKKK
jgi:hypothetical protein